MEVDRYVSTMNHLRNAKKRHGQLKISSCQKDFHGWKKYKSSNSFCFFI